MKLVKMHGAGNDFLLAFEDELPGATMEPLVAALCHRRLGLGADGCMVLEREAFRQVRIRYWNRDGSPAAFCANGARCAARLAARRWGWQELVLNTGAGLLNAQVMGRTVRLTVPSPGAVEPWREFEVRENMIRGRLVEVGVPHLVVPVTWPDFWTALLEPLAAPLRSHPNLPVGGANVHILRLESRTGMALRSWERGVEGETLSCGSGVVAAALVAAGEGWVGDVVHVATASGRSLQVDIPPGVFTGSAALTGPAELVAELEIAPEFLSTGGAPRELG